MSYCTITDVQGLLVNYPISANSKISTTTVQDEIIPEYDRYIDDRLGRYYVTPITGEKALLTMNRIEKLLVAAEISERTFIGQAPSDSTQAATWRTQAEGVLTMIVDGDIILVDATPTDETPESKAQRISDNLSSPAYNNPPYFQTGMKF